MHRWMIDSWVGDWMDGGEMGRWEMDGWGGGEKGGVPGPRFLSDPGMNLSGIAWNQEAPVLAALEDAAFSGLG